MKPVVQLELTGCGIARVAALTGLTYPRDRAFASTLGIYAADTRLWLDTAHVRRLLRHLGLQAGRTEQPFRNWDGLPDLALLAIKWHLQHGWPFWQWVAFVRDGKGARLLDPKRSLKNHRRTDFARIKPKWFMDVRGQAA